VDHLLDFDLNFLRQGCFFWLKNLLVVYCFLQTSERLVLPN
jgi:hypothetical protein